MLSIGENVVVCCIESILEEKEREKVRKNILETGRKLIEISNEQTNHFAANVLQVENNKKEKVMILSESAFRSFNEEQLKILKETNQHLAVVKKNYFN